MSKAPTRKATAQKEKREKREKELKRRKEELIKLLEEDQELRRSLGSSLDPDDKAKGYHPDGGIKAALEEFLKQANEGGRGEFEGWTNEFDEIESLLSARGEEDLLGSILRQDRRNPLGRSIPFPYQEYQCQFQSNLIIVPDLSLQASKDSDLGKDMQWFLKKEK